MPQGIVRYQRFTRVGKQVKLQCHKLLKRISVTFQVLAKIKFANATTPQGIARY
jgi:hypothetical protein